MSTLKEMNKVFFDREAKEHVLITNGICRLNHSNTEAFRKSHGANGCEYIPNEAIAIRAFPSKDGSVQIAWTYRGVDHTKLSECDQSAKEMFDAVMSHRRSKNWIGRV